MVVCYLGTLQNIYRKKTSDIMKHFSETNADMYIQELQVHLRENGQTMKFNTVSAAGGYVSSIQIGNNTYGSEGR